MSNSYDLTSGHFSDIQKKYEILFDIITELSGKMYGSRSNVMQDNLTSLNVYLKFQKVKRKKQNRSLITSKN